MRRQTALAKKGRTASKSSLSASAGSSSCKSVCRLTSASRSGAGPSNGTLCIKAWMAVPRSAPVMPVFCKNAGRSSATGRAAWATALTLTLAGTFSSASRGLRQAKLAFSISTTAGSAAGRAVRAAVRSPPAGAARGWPAVRGAARNAARKLVYSHSALLSGWSSAAVKIQPAQLVMLRMASGPVASAAAQSAGSLREDAAFSAAP